MMIVPISVLFLLANVVNAAPLKTRADSRSLLASRQFDLGSIGDLLGSGGGTSSSSSSGDNSSFGSTVSQVADFLGLGGNSNAAAAAPAAPAAQDGGNNNGASAADAASTADAATPSPVAAADATTNTTTDSNAAAAADATSNTTVDATATATADATTNTPADATATVAADSTTAANANTAVGACGPSGINAATVSLIKSFEGFVASPAPDPIGLPTVGFGHLCKSSGCAEVPFPFPLSQSTAAQLLQQDVGPFVNCINGAVNNNVVLNDNQLGALTSWSFNVGCGAAKASTLVKRLNNGEDPNTVAAQELPKFNKAGGKVLAGLTRRRAAEVNLFQTASNVQAHPC